MNSILASLQSCSDLYSIKLRLQAICARFGTVQRLDVVAADQAGQRRALCFLRMSTAQEEQELMNALGIGRFAGDLVLLVELQAKGDDAPLGWAALSRQGGSGSGMSGQAWH